LTEEAAVSSYDADKIAEMILDLTDVALSFVDKRGMGSKVSRNLYASLEKGASKEAKKKAVDKAKDVAAEISKQVLKNEVENINEDVSERKNIKSINDILKGLKDITKNKRKSPRNFESSGGYEQALKDFESLNPINVKEIQTQYGPGKFGTLDDGTKVVARRGSKSDGATLEITNSSGKIFKIRY